jgi:hypothetical protein
LEEGYSFLGASKHRILGEESYHATEQLMLWRSEQVLYSGVGKSYYASARMGLGPSSLPGWVFKGTPTRTYTIELPATSTSTPSEEQDQKPEQRAEKSTPDGWEYLSAEKVRELEPRVAEEIEKQLRERETGGKVQVAVLPTK